MSSVVISGNTSGTVTLFAPDVSGTTVLTLPTANGTVLTTATGQTLTSPSISGNLTMTTGGITFNANPGGGTQATLNDYEVGTWTPVVTIGATTLTATGSAGYYTKIGNLVTFTAIVTGVTKAGTGSLQITIPFANSGSKGYGTATVRFGNITTGGTQILAFPQPGATALDFQVYSGNGYVGDVSHTTLAATFDLYAISGFYYTN